MDNVGSTNNRGAAARRPSWVRCRLHRLRFIFIHFLVNRFGIVIYVIISIIAGCGIKNIQRYFVTIRILSFVFFFVVIVVVLGLKILGDPSQSASLKVGLHDYFIRSFSGKVLASQNLQHLMNAISAVKIVRYQGRSVSSVHFQNERRITGGGQILVVFISIFGVSEPRRKGCVRSNPIGFVTSLITSLFVLVLLLFMSKHISSCFQNPSHILMEIVHQRLSRRAFGSRVVTVITRGLRKCRRRSIHANIFGFCHGRCQWKQSLFLMHLLN
mmetsp:Transcript_37111/g.77115  ORF Transcript_37111/g.77115 Transcript_37111/m.77115 type:complete len:271 (+) Transcript_37111:2121-2933(+)